MGTEPSGDPRPGDLSLLVAAFDESPVPTLRVEITDGLVDRILDANPAARRALGSDDPSGQPLADLLVTAPQLTLVDGMTQHLVTVDSPGEGVRWIEMTIVALSPAASPGRSAALVLLHDVTERRDHDHRRDLAQGQDLLTGLANRHALLMRLAELDLAIDGPEVAVLFIDLDRFKPVNDQRGHAMGDAVLTRVAHRLHAVVRPEDLVARVGGDEFVVVCPRLGGAADAAAIAERVRASLDQPAEVGGRPLRITASVGVATAEVGLLDPAALLAAADAAMYAAKQGGGNRVSVEPLTSRRARWLSGRRRGSRRR